jgi:hypothetical protein
MGPSGTTVVVGIATFWAAIAIAVAWVFRAATFALPAPPRSPEARHRRWVARLVLGVYLTLGLLAFSLSVTFLGGEIWVRTRSASLIAIGAVAGAWLVTHFVLTRNGGGRPRDGSPVHRILWQVRRPLEWLAGYVVMSSVMAVAFQLGSRDETRPESWGNAFLSAGFAVLAVGATIAACLHHHTYIHHGHHDEAISHDGERNLTAGRGV